jgi:hypothetical protein
MINTTVCVITIFISIAAVCFGISLRKETNKIKTNKK